MQSKESSFLAIHPTLDVVYAVSEIADLNGQPTGGIISFTIDMKNGHLTKQSEQPSNGKGPCHLSLDTLVKLSSPQTMEAGALFAWDLLMMEAFSHS